MTADHGVAPVVEYAQQFRLPAKRSPLGKPDEVKAKLEAGCGSSSVSATADRKAAAVPEGRRIIRSFCSRSSVLAEAGQFRCAQNDGPRLAAGSAVCRGGVHARGAGENGRQQAFQQVQRTFHPQPQRRCAVCARPYTVPGAKGTTHGSPWHYDTHVPLIAHRLRDQKWPVQPRGQPGLHRLNGR